MLVMDPQVSQDLPEALKKWLVAQAVNVATRSPMGTAGLLLTGINQHMYDRYGVSKQWYGVHIDTDHPYWIQRLGAPLDSSPTRTTPPSSGGKREAPSKKGSQRASGDAKHRRAHKCPKGHYWSYKQKKCVKSKFHQG